MLGIRLTGEPVDLPATALLPYSTGNLKLGLYGTGKRAKFGMPHPDQELFDSQKPDLLTEYPYGDRFGAERKLRAPAGILAGRHFQPWEGGEGQAMGQHVRSHPSRPGDLRAVPPGAGSARTRPKIKGPSPPHRRPPPRP